MIQATVPYFTFDGEATEALDFYKKVFQAEITQMHYFHETEGFSGDKNKENESSMQDWRKMRKIYFISLIRLKAKQTRAIA